MRRILLLLAVLAFLGTYFAFIPQGIAKADANIHKNSSVTQCAVNPNDTNCDGVDPVVGGCSGDATTATSTVSGNIKIELRYSTKCRSNWARFTLPGGSSAGIYAFVVRPSQTVGGVNWPFYSTSTPIYYNTSQVYSNMVYAPGTVAAFAAGCIHVDGGCLYTKTV